MSSPTMPKGKYNSINMVNIIILTIVVVVILTIVVPKGNIALVFINVVKPWLID